LVNRRPNRATREPRMSCLLWLAPESQPSSNRFQNGSYFWLFRFITSEHALREMLAFEFISEPVLTRFKSRIGLVTVVDQIPKLLGIHFAQTTCFHDVAAIMAHRAQTSRLFIGHG